MKRHGTNEWIPCIETNAMALDHNVHTYVSSGGHEQRRKSHYIHSIKFYDNEDEMAAEKEEQDEMVEVREPEPRDLLHLGNIDGYVLEDMDAAKKAYNDELIRYNSKFAQLVGKLHSN